MRSAQCLPSASPLHHQGTRGTGGASESHAMYLGSHWGLLCFSKVTGFVSKPVYSNCTYYSNSLTLLHVTKTNEIRVYKEFFVSNKVKLKNLIITNH